MSSRRSIGNTFHVTTVTDGTNGTNAFSVDLSNEMDSVACDNDMKTAAAFNIYSHVAAFYGVEDVTALCQIRYTSKPTNASLTLETSGSGTGSTSLTTTFQTISTKQWIRIHYNSGVAVSKRETLEVEINHATYGTIALSIAVVGMKGGAIYNLVPSANAITHKKDGTYTPNVITCGSSKLDVATGTTSSNPSEATIKYSADGGSVTNYPSGGLTAGTNFTNYVTFFLYVNNTVVDKETVNIVTDGTNGTNGSDGKDGKDGSDGKDGKDGAEGYGLKLTLERSGRYSESSWNTWGTIGRSEPWGKIDGDSDFTACRVGDYFIVTGTSTDKGIRHTEQFRCTSVSANSIIGTCVSHVKDGQEGSRGRIGRFFYYVGTWTGDTVKTYIVNDAQAPYFKYGSNYFVFNPKTNGNYTESQMGTPSTSSSNWDIMTNDFKYIITEAIFGAYAHFGSFIINGDWLISQHGTINGSANPNYTAFDPNHPNDNTGSNFIPHFAVNGLTGKSYQNDAYIKGQVVATSGEFSGTIRAGSTRIVGNLDLTDTSNGMTVYDSESVPRINLQPKAISTIATLANDTYNYYNLYNTKTGASSFEVTTSEQSFSFAKYENLDIDKFSVTMYSSGSNGTLFPSSYYTYLAILITHPSGDTTTINITTSRVSSYGSFQNLTSKTRFVAPVAGTYKVKITVTNPGSWTSGQTSVYASVSARYQSSKDTQVYIAKDGFYAHAGANKLIWAGETETQIRYGFNGIRWNDADPKGNRSMDVVAGVKGTLPNGKPLWLPFYNFIPTFGVGTGTKPYLFTSQYIYNISETKYAFKIDPYRDRGVCIVYSGYHAYGGDEQESWVVLPPETFTDSDGSTVGLPVGYQITIINWTHTNIYVVPNANSNHGAVIVDAHRDNNWYASLNGSQSRDTYIYVGSWAGLGVVWLAMHDTQ